jgi:hypothetical protein
MKLAEAFNHLCTGFDVAKAVTQRRKGAFGYIQLQGHSACTTTYIKICANFLLRRKMVQRSTKYLVCSSHCDNHTLET